MKIDIWNPLFPRRCPVCQEVVEDRGEQACRICRLRLPYVREPFCLGCGRPITSEEKEYCRSCADGRDFIKGRGAFVYDEVMRRSIAGFKYGGRREFAAFYAEEILRRWAKEAVLWKAEALVPIPLHPSRRRKRGYNQAELLAAELSRRAGVPMDAGLLLRTKKTRPQKDLDDGERLKNLKGAFSVRKRPVPYKNVILVDDIYTTGSTVNSAARVLKENGVQFVYFLCICVGRGL